MRALIVDDHQLVASGMRLLLAEWIPVENVMTCADGDEALRLVAAQAFELVLLDWNLGGGADAAGAPLIRQLCALSSAKIVVVSADTREQTVRDAIDAGAVGFVFKNAEPRLLTDVLKILRHGGIYLPQPTLAGGPGAAAARSAVAPGPPRAHVGLREIGDAFPGLTPRHAEVLARLVRGMSNKRIARELDIADGTVKQHLVAIFREMGVDNRTEAVYALARQGVRLP